MGKFLVVVPDKDASDIVNIALGDQRIWHPDLKPKIWFSYSIREARLLLDHLEPGPRDAVLCCRDTPLIITANPEEDLAKADQFAEEARRLGCVTVAYQGNVAELRDAMSQVSNALIVAMAVERA